MRQVVLENRTNDNHLLQAIFLPENGMNLMSYSKGDLQVIDQNTRKGFEDYCAGLGCIIGPHFYLQRKDWIVPIKDETLFPHLAFTKKKGFADPFSHGIGRYVPWNFTATDRTISAYISGKDIWKGIPLSELEGTDFTMNYEAELTPDGLDISLKVSSERLSIIGLHTYYGIPPGMATISSSVQNQYNDMGHFKPMPQSWMKENKLKLHLDESADFGFLPLSDNLGVVMFETSAYKLRMRYKGTEKEVSWQLYHPLGASFVCIEPMSAKNPRELTATASSIQVQISIL